MKHTIQEIFRIYGPQYIENNKLSNEQWKVYNSIIKCKKELGIHTITCNDCGDVTIGLNSCRNRHCPMCQFYAKEKWINNECNYLLDCPYFHIVTTIPAELNELVIYNQKEIYNILFKATSESILELTEDSKWLGAKVGITSILHSWGGTMELHPHIHCIVTGGGLKNNKWIQVEKDFLFKVQVLSSLFKGKFLSMLKALDLKLPSHLSYLKDYKTLNDFLRPLYKKEWVSYIQSPKGQPENVIEYIGRYAFRIAISNERIKDVSNGIITFEYKDSKDNNKIKIMNLDAMEFIRRFFLHVLPNHFMKIRHYGLLANRNKKSSIKFCRLLIGQKIFSDFTTKLKRTLHKFLCPICNSNNFSYSFYYSST
jgi:hypothetical protein